MRAVHTGGPLPGWMAPVTVPASWAYGGVVRVRNRWFDRGLSVHSLDRPVISVGNLVLGGAGKSPMVAHLAALLLDEGHRPVIALRGYGARKGERSDEHAEYAARLPEIPIVARPDRHAALAEFLPGHREIDCVLLDDGFQHRRLARDLDLVLIDASRPTFGERLFPAGNLREPPGSLQRAGAVVVTRAEDVDAQLAACIRSSHGHAPVAWASHAWTDVEVHHGTTRREPVAWLAGKRVATMLGVAHPRPIELRLESHAADVVRRVAARDHERYGPAKVAHALSLARGLDALVVTAKDWVKLRGIEPTGGWPLPIVVPRLALDVFAGAAALERLVLGVVTGFSR